VLVNCSFSTSIKIFFPLFGIYFGGSGIFKIMNPKHVNTLGGAGVRAEIAGIGRDIVAH